MNLSGFLLFPLDQFVTINSFSFVILYINLSCIAFNIYILLDCYGRLNLVTVSLCQDLVAVLMAGLQVIWTCFCHRETKHK